MAEPVSILTAAAAPARRLQEHVPLPDDSLVEQIRALHAASWGWALACCGRNPDEAGDVLQAAYAKVLAGDARFEGRSTLRTWLFGVIRITAHEHRRRRWLRAVRSAVLDDQAPERPSVADPTEIAARSERGRALAAALALLPDRQREVLHLVFYEGLTVVEAAEAMGVGAGTARIHYDRGKKRLHAELTKKGVTL